MFGNRVVEIPGHDFRVRSDVYTDDAIFAAEMERIFESTWVYVGHESEIPNPGDFKVTAIGRVPVIVVRGESGDVNVLINACRHRGSVVCRQTRGTARTFICPYHNWAYGLDGRLLGIPDAGAYATDFQASIGGLATAGRVTVYRQLVFASISAEGESLEHHLGAVRPYVDLWADQSPSGRMRVQNPRPAVYPANWKFQLENTTDGWHANFVHGSAFRTVAEFRANQPLVDSMLAGQVHGFEHGHGILERSPRTRFAPEIEADYLDTLDRAHGREHAREAYHGWYITLFPNVHLMEFKIRVVQPVAVDRTIVYEFPLQYEGVSERVNRAISQRMNFEGSMSTSMIQTDDFEVFTRVQSGLKASRQVDWVVFSRGISSEEEESSGERIAPDSHETPQRSIYREWARLMGPA
jgi:phenylpropionate dioxygenase-like ring-hydroxylating dioxygenase large terminal subunit